MFGRRKEAGEDVVIFFATDIHGSDICFKKFISSWRFYKAQVLVLGGDLTGKMIVPLVQVDRSSSYEAMYMGKRVEFDTGSEMERFERSLSDAGYYPCRLSQDEFQHMKESPIDREALFTSLVMDRLKRWLGYADAKLHGTGIPLYVSPGNDDEFVIDALFDNAEAVTNVEGRVVEIPGGYEMISTGFSNPTPWHTARECSEEDLETKIGSMATHLRNPPRAIFNIHVPPYDSTLDVCPALDSDLKPVTDMGRQVMTAAGSTGVRRCIEAYQPLCSLHGHIHESRGYTHVQRTLAFNPGSEYSEGILRGCRVVLHKGEVKQHQLTSG